MAAILIVEDELLIAEEIAHLVRTFGHAPLEPVASADAALETLSRRFVELVLMDINLGGERDGVAAAVLIRRQFAVPVVFLTAHSDQATLNRAKLAQPYGYVVKPFTEESLRAQLEMALFNAYPPGGAARAAWPAPAPAAEAPASAAAPLPADAASKYFFVRKGSAGAHVKIRADDILYFEARGNAVRLHTPTEKFVLDATIKELEQRLPASFFRTHRSFVVNLDHVTAYEESGVLVAGAFIPVSRSAKDELRKRLQFLG